MSPVPMKPFFFLLTLFLLSACNSSDEEVRGEHESSATVEMHPSRISRENKNFVRNQLATLQTSHILEAAATELQMKPEALKKSLEISQVRENGFIKITAHHDDKTMPKLMVTTLLDSYRKFRKDQEKKWSTDQLSALARSIKEQEKIVLNTSKDNATWAYGIPYFDSGDLQKTEEQMIQSAKDKLAQFEKQAALTKKQIGKLEKLDDEQLILYAAGLDLPGNEVAIYYEQYKEATGNRQRLLDSGLGRTHPDIVREEEKMRTTLDKAKEECRTILKNLKIKLKLVEAQIPKMGQMLEDRGSENESLKSRQLTYRRAREEHEDAKLLLRELEARKERVRSFFESTESFFTIRDWEHQ